MIQDLIALSASIGAASAGPSDWRSMLVRVDVASNASPEVLRMIDARAEDFVIITEPPTSVAQRSLVTIMSTRAHLNDVNSSVLRRCGLLRAKEGAAELRCACSDLDLWGLAIFAAPGHYHAYRRFRVAFTSALQSIGTAPPTILFSQAFFWCSAVLGRLAKSSEAWLLRRWLMEEWVRRSVLAGADLDALAVDEVRWVLSDPVEDHRHPRCYEAWEYVRWLMRNVLDRRTVAEGVDVIGTFLKRHPKDATAASVIVDVVRRDRTELEAVLKGVFHWSTKALLDACCRDVLHAAATQAERTVAPHVDAVILLRQGLLDVIWTHGAGRNGDLLWTAVDEMELLGACSDALLGMPSPDGSASPATVHPMDGPAHARLLVHWGYVLRQCGTSR